MTLRSRLNSLRRGIARLAGDDNGHRPLCLEDVIWQMKALDEWLDGLGLDARQAHARGLQPPAKVASRRFTAAEQLECAADAERFLLRWERAGAAASVRSCLRRAEELEGFAYSGTDFRASAAKWQAEVDDLDRQIAEDVRLYGP
jgi:hypothetical protein